MTEIYGWIIERKNREYSYSKWERAWSNKIYNTESIAREALRQNQKNDRFSLGYNWRIFPVYSDPEKIVEIKDDDYYFWNNFLTSLKKDSSEDNIRSLFDYATQQINHVRDVMIRQIVQQQNCPDDLIDQAKTISNVFIEYHIRNRDKF